jgi:hypothetical protein
MINKFLFRRIRVIRNINIPLTGILNLFLLTNLLQAQDLDPRAYVRAPIKANVLITGFAFSKGGVVTDATLPITDFKASVEMITLGYVRTFSLFGMTAQAFGVLPYSWAQASALVTGQQQSITRSGFADSRIRLSVLVYGAPAATREELAKAPRKTVIGTSLTIGAPTGQFFPDKLINLGTNRWSFKPEIALSHPFGPRWLMDIYGGVWFFTNNDSFYPGTSIRTQAPLYAFQGHLSYTIKPGFWAAFDATFYAGGNSSVNGIDKNDRQENSRFGATLAMPTGKRHSIRITCSTGAIIRYGANFSTVSVAWQNLWYKKQPSEK